MPVSGSKSMIAAWCVGRSVLPGKSVTSLQPRPGRREIGRHRAEQPCVVREGGDPRRHRDRRRTRAPHAPGRAQPPSSSQIEERLDVGACENDHRLRTLTAAASRASTVLGLDRHRRPWPAGAAASSRRARPRARRTAIATALSPSMLRESRIVTRSRSMPRSSLGTTTKWWTAPQASASDDEPELDEQHVAVAGRPEVVHVRQTQDAEIRPCDEQQSDEHRREAREAEERRAPQARRAPARRPRRAGRAHRSRGLRRSGAPSRRARRARSARRRPPSGPRARVPTRGRGRRRTRARAGHAGR